MAVAEDISTILRQEQELVFDRFDEEAAFAIGCAIHDRAKAEGLTLVVDIRLWDRPLFYYASRGTTADNPDWTRRKFNVVRRFHKSTYRMVLEKTFEGRAFPHERGLDPADYVLAGGGFPITVSGAGMIGAVVVSGLPERQDHEVAIAAICAHLGRDMGAYALSAE